jgi:hypothetical protein
VGLAKIHQVEVIGPNFCRRVVSLNVMTIFFESSNNGKEFLVVNFIVLFMLIKRL